MIDLHTHTTESDGTLSPFGLIEAAKAARLDAIAITDHDTFAGYDQAAGLAAQAAIELVCGIELSTKMPQRDRPRSKAVHLLGYWPKSAPSAEFREWIASLQRSRHERNLELVERLCATVEDSILHSMVPQGTRQDRLRSFVLNILDSIIEDTGNQRFFFVISLDPRRNILSSFHERMRNFIAAVVELLLEEGAE